MKELEFYLWAHVLLYLHKNEGKDFSAMDLCKELNISSTASVSINTKLLEKYGLVKIVKKGRYNAYNLTKDGDSIAGHLTAIFSGLKTSRKK